MKKYTVIKKKYINMQVPVTLPVTFVPSLKTNDNMTCKLDGRSIPTVIASDKIQCTIEPSRSTILSCNISIIQ